MSETYEAAAETWVAMIDVALEEGDCAAFPLERDAAGTLP